MASYELKDDGDRGVLVLAGDFDISQARTLKQALEEAMAKYQDFDLDMSAVEGGDLSLMQALFAAEFAMVAREKTMGCRGQVPVAVLTLADEAGFRHMGSGQCFWRREA